jgi:hypothetical protein
VSVTHAFTCLVPQALATAAVLPRLLMDPKAGYF